MITGFVKRAAATYKRPVVRWNDTLRRSYGSITKKNSNILRGCILKRNPAQLLTEVFRISNEAAVTSSASASTSTVNNVEIIARLCVTAEAVEVDLAFEILECLDEVTPETMVLGTFELIDTCVAYNYIDDAMRAYFRLKNMGVLLDFSRKEVIVQALAADCRVNDLIIVLHNHAITDNDLVLAAEPLIMSGNTTAFSSFLIKYLDQKRNLLDPLQCPDEVSRIIRSIMAARLKRFFDSSEPSQDENTGMLNILIALQSYYMRASYSQISKYTNIYATPSYFHSRQLSEIEKERGLEIAESYTLTDHQQGLIEHLPEFENTYFPFVSEGNGQNHVVHLHRLRINDLTAELKRKDPTRALLFSKNIFPDTYETVNTYLQQRTIMHAIKNVMTRTGVIVDVVINNDREEEEELFIIPTGHSGLPPSFPIFDITEFLSTRKNPLNLVFNNDVFDRQHDVEAEDVRYFDPKKSRSTSSSDHNNRDTNNRIDVEVVVVVRNPEDDEPDS